MRHFILASHAYFSKGIVSALNLIIGRQDNLSYYCAYVDDEHFKEPLLKEINSYDDCDEIVIMTDLFGGSVNNELLDLTKRDNVHLVTGVNLIFVMSILLDGSSEPVGEVIMRLIQEAKEGLIYCNDMKNMETSEALDEF